MASCGTRRADDNTTHRALLQRMSYAPTKGKTTAYFAPLGAQEVLSVESCEEFDGDWGSDVDDDSESDLSYEVPDVGDGMWNMGNEDIFLNEEEYEMYDAI